MGYGHYGATDVRGDSQRAAVSALYRGGNSVICVVAKSRASF
jgi:hypothetical protein